MWGVDVDETGCLPAGKAAVNARKFIGKLMRNKRKGEVVTELKGVVGEQLTARARAETSDAAEQSGDELTEMEGVAERRVGKDGNLRALVADNSNCIWTAWQSGKLERYYYNGLLKATKVLLHSLPLSIS